MTVLPNAPIDSATGLPVPTIAVGTEGGVSVIKDDGNVVDLTQNSPYTVTNNVFFSDYGKLLYDMEDTSVVYEVDIPSSDINYGGYSSTSNGRVIYPVGTHAGFSSGEIRLLGRNMGNGGKLITKGAFAFDENGNSEIINGLTLFDREEFDPAKKSLVAFVASDYNTGWMHGDCKGAFLSDTTAESLTINTNLASTFTQIGTARLTSETYDDGDTSWQMVDNSGSVNGYVMFAMPNLTVGQTYFISMTWDNNAVTDNSAYGQKIVHQNGLSGQNDTEFTHWNKNNGSSETLTGSFTAQTTNDDVLLIYANAITLNVSNFIVRAVDDEDRSVNNKGLAVYGTVTKSVVATGSDLIAYSGFSASNYLKQPYNSGLDFGTGDFSIMFWFKTPSGSVPTECFLHRGDGGTGTWGSGKIIQIEFNSTNLAAFLAESAFSSYDTVTVTGTKAATGQWMHYTLVRSGTSVKAYLNGEVNGTASSSKNLTNTSASTWIGERPNSSRPATTSSLALFRMSASAPSPEQIKKMYEDEKVLFQENAKATLYGSSDTVTALAFDDDTNLLHVGTSSGRSDFQGLRRINNNTTAVTTAITAQNEFIIEQ